MQPRLPHPQAGPRGAPRAREARQARCGFQPGSGSAMDAGRRGWEAGGLVWFRGLRPSSAPSAKVSPSPRNLSGAPRKGRGGRGSPSACPAAHHLPSSPSEEAPAGLSEDAIHGRFTRDLSPSVLAALQRACRGRAPWSQSHSRVAAFPARAGGGPRASPLTAQSLGFPLGRTDTSRLAPRDGREGRNRAGTRRAPRSAALAVVAVVIRARVNQRGREATRHPPLSHARALTLLKARCTRSSAAA